MGRESIYLLQSSSKLVPNTFRIKILITLRRIGVGRY